MLQQRHLLPLLTCLISFSSAFGAFFAAVPNEFRPGWPLTIAVTAHKTNEDRIFIDAVLTPSNDRVEVYNVVSDFVSPGETKILKLQVPEIALSHGSQAVLTLTTSGAVKHTSEKFLKYNANSSLVFVETDKAIYKPGQKVNMRVVHVDKDLKPIIKPLTAVIVNPKDSKLEEFKDIASRTGVADLKYELLQSASLGKWKIQVTDEAQMLYTKEFTVEEYVLPKFSVEVKANPGYIVADSQSASIITVLAKYTHGKGVQGNCRLTLSLSGSSSVTTFTKELSETGATDFSDIDWKPFYQVYDSSLNLLVTASVTDETGRTEVGQTTIIVYLFNAKVKILPKSTTVFRIGLPAEIFIRVTDQGGNPINASKVEVQLALPGMERVNVTLTVPDGQVDVAYNFTPVANPNDNDEQYWRTTNTIKATLVSNSRVQSKLHVALYESEYNNVIAAVPVTDKVPRVGEGVEYKILKSSSSEEATVGFMVISQGSIQVAGIPVDDVITIVPTMEMCPLAKLFVYMIVGKNKLEVVADSLDISPTHCFAKEVDVGFDAAEVRSGVNATLKVRVSRRDGSNELPGTHNVYYIGVDKSLVLLQGRTDLSTDEVLSGMFSLNLKSPLKADDQFPPRSAGKIIEDLGLATFTSANVKNNLYYDDDCIEDLCTMEYLYDLASIDGAVSKEFDMSSSNTDENKEQVEPQKPPVETKVRKHFPETWLWGHAVTDTRGHLDHAVTLPDTITKWLVSAFAISDEGLVTARGPFELTSFQIFFLTMNLPYSIKRGEVFVLRVTVFNYRAKTVEGVVKLASSAQFTAIDDDEKDGWLYKVVEIPANRAASVEYKINATVIGLLDLHVIAEDVADGIKDEVKQKLLVKPEGERRSKAITRVLFLKSQSSISETFAITWPGEGVVPDSKSVEVKVTGVPLGQSLSNLQRLVSVPCGCGEQNMVTTVPNIYGLTYIQSSDHTDNSELTNSMVINMKSGYQRQVDMYRHGDGSYSAWGPKALYHSESAGSGGSVWLTAFVVKSFSRAAEFITVDSAVLSSGAKFLANSQRSSGAFEETGQVFHSEMQAGTGSGAPLTVYVLISLLETGQAVGGGGVDVQRQIDRAVGYMKETLNPDSLRRDKNRFLAAMSAYALSLMPDRTSVNLLLNQLLSVVADGDAPWEGKGEQQKKLKHAADEYYVAASPSNRVETAAYYLLTLVRLGRLGEGLEVMKWLQSQQNSLGGYYSTQDTVMALQALSEFGVAFRNSPFATDVHIREPESGQSFNVSMEGSRAFLLHTVELPAETTTVEITATGPVNSSCVVKVVYNYYTLAGDDDSASEPKVSVFTKTSLVSKNIQKVQACIQSSKSLKYKGMFVATLALPSGEQAVDEPSTILKNNPKASRVEVNEGLIHFYMDEAPGEGYCLHAQVERQMEFEVQKPGSAKLYAYYEPGTAQEVALVMDGVSCSQGSCEKDSAVVLNMASVLLTITICLLATLLLCV